ncbi:MAG TPA: hypothetical protein VFE44_00335, partial [Thermoanaerobaculia bacterium]|nr:hypothetical protein [Thermoanaerobaculia bacterium]
MSGWSPGKASRGFPALVALTWGLAAPPATAAAATPAPPAMPDLVVQTGHVGDVVRALWSPDGAFLATLGGSGDGTVSVWSPGVGRLLAPIAAPSPIQTATWAADSWSLAVGSADGRIRIWDRGSGRFTGELERRRPSDQLAFSRGGDYLAALDAEGVAVWDGRSRRLLWTASAHRGAYAPLAWAPDGRRVATASLIWDAPAGEALVKLRDYAVHGMGSEPLVWSPDGGFLAAINGASLKVWSAQSGELLA